MASGTSISVPSSDAGDVDHDEVALVGGPLHGLELGVLGCAADRFAGLDLVLGDAAEPRPSISRPCVSQAHDGIQPATRVILMSTSTAPASSASRTVLQTGGAVVTGSGRSLGVVVDRPGPTSRAALRRLASRPSISLANHALDTLRGALPGRKPGMRTSLAMRLKAASIAESNSDSSTSTESLTLLSSRVSIVLLTVLLLITQKGNGATRGPTVGLRPNAGRGRRPSRYAAATRGCSSTARTSAFQADDASSILVTRSRRSPSGPPTLVTAAVPVRMIEPDTEVEPMRVLLMADDDGLFARGADTLREAGHEVVGCHEAGAAADRWPCAGVNETCPLDQGVDAAVALPRSSTSRVESGVGCVIRQHVPLVIGGAGADAHAGVVPHAAQVVEGVGPDLATAVDQVSHAPVGKLSAAATESVAATAARIGLHGSFAADVLRDRRAIRIVIHSSVELDSAKRSALSQAVLAPVRAMLPVDAVDSIDVALASAE